MGEGPRCNPAVQDHVPPLTSAYLTIQTQEAKQPLLQRLRPPQNRMAVSPGLPALDKVSTVTGRPGPLHLPNLSLIGPQSSEIGSCPPLIFLHPCRRLPGPEADSCGPWMRGHTGTSLEEINLLADLEPPLGQKMQQDTGKSKPEPLKIFKGRRGVMVFFSPSFWKVCLTNTSCGCLASMTPRSTLTLGGSL